MTLAVVLRIFLGAAFLLSGLLKAIHPFLFAGHLRRLGVPVGIALQLSLVGIFLEATVGAALVVGLREEYLLPATLALLFAFSMLTAWGALSKRVEDCGCYGAAVVLTPVRSLALNGIYAATTVFVWWQSSAPYRGDNWRYIAVGSCATFTLAISLFAVRRFTTDSRPLFDMSRVRVGRQWSSRWPQLPEAPTVLVAFLSTSCPKCERWPKVLNALHGLEGAPALMAIVGDTDEKVIRWRTEHHIRFPVRRLGLAPFNQLVNSVPVAALIQDGIIRQVWLGGMPPELISRIRERVNTGNARPDTN